MKQEKTEWELVKKPLGVDGNEVAERVTTFSRGDLTDGVYFEGIPTLADIDILLDLIARSMLPGPLQKLRDAIVFKNDNDAIKPLSKEIRAWLSAHKFFGNIRAITLTILPQVEARKEYNGKTIPPERSIRVLAGGTLHSTGRGEIGQVGHTADIFIPPLDKSVNRPPIPVQFFTAPFMPEVTEQQLAMLRDRATNAKALRRWEGMLKNPILIGGGNVVDPRTR